MASTQGSISQLRIFDDFLGPDNDLTFGAGTVKVGNFGFVSVQEGSFEWTSDEPGGIVAITTDTGTSDNAWLIAGTFKPDDGALYFEARFKVDVIDIEIFAGFVETVSLGTPLAPATFTTVTMSYAAGGAKVGVQYDTAGTVDDFRSVFGDSTSALAGATANGVRAGWTPTADSWIIVKAEIEPTGGKARVYVGGIDVDPQGESIKLVEEITVPAVLGEANLYGVLAVENSGGGATVMEVDYILVTGSRDWTH